VHIAKTHRFICKETAYCALAMSILTECTPEQSFARLGVKEPKKTITCEDIQDMVMLKESLTYKQIGTIYNLSDKAVFNRIKKYRRENR